MKELRDHSCDACDEAIRQLQKLVATTEGIDRARALMDLGMAALIGWRLDLALASFGASLDLLPPGEFPDLEREALYKESCVLAEMGRYDEAIERVSRAKAMCERGGDLEHLTLCEWREGTYFASVGRMEEGLELIATSRDRYLALLQPEMAALCQLDLEHLSEAYDRVQSRNSRERDCRRSRRRP